MNRRLVIVGAGQIAEVADWYFTRESEWEVVGFSVDSAYLAEDSFAGRPVRPLEELESHFPPANVACFVAFGYNQMSRPRRAKVEALKQRGYHLTSFVHPRSEIWGGLKVGPNSFILEHNTIQPFVTIGANSFLWSGNHIGHHSHLGAHMFIASHVVISGAVTIGDHSFLGVNATVRDNVSLGEAVVVGAGATVMTDVPDQAVIPGRSSEAARITSDKLKSL